MNSHLQMVLWIRLFTAAQSLQAVFDPASIREYTDGGQTALCPKCSIDSVIPAQAGWELTAEFLTAMRVYWFE
jgi:hypothetical protein